MSNERSNTYVTVFWVSVIFLVIIPVVYLILYHSGHPTTVWLIDKVWPAIKGLFS